MLDKFILVNIDWVVRFIESKDILQKKKIAEFLLIDQITVSVLKVITLVSENFTSVSKKEKVSGNAKSL